MANSVYHRINAVQTFVLPRRCIPTSSLLRPVPEVFIDQLQGEIAFASAVIVAFIYIGNAVFFAQTVYNIYLRYQAVM
ncbi:MAG: hypothetical protein PHI28_16275, partial [Mangrovibacterium sp.]|nr:hypothetical protein [Mangrovibacterium sp.]